MDPKLAKYNEKVVEYIGCTAAAFEQIEKEAQARAEKAAEVAKKVPTAVALMKKYDYIDPHQEKDASDALQDHGKAIEILCRVIEKYAQARIGSTTGPVKTAANTRGSLDSPWVGVRTSEPKESDRRFLEKLGLAR